MEKVKILIAEDDKIVKRLYEQAFIDEVFERQIVTNGEDALNQYLAWNPDIVVLDIMMPVMTGYTVLKTIRTDHSDQTTTIIMASSISDKENIVSCLKLGIQGYIAKPFKSSEVVKKVLDYYHQKNPQKAEVALKTFDEKKSAEK